MGYFPPYDNEDGIAVTITPWHRCSIGYELIGGGGGTLASNAWPVAAKAIYVPILVPRRITAVKMFTLNGATASGNQDVGIYDSQGNRLVSIGATAQAGISAMQVHDTTDLIMEAGRYYMGLANSGTTGTYLSCTSQLAQVLGGYGVLNQASAGTLPSTATFATCSSAYLPMFGLTARTLT